MSKQAGGKTTLPAPTRAPQPAKSNTPGGAPAPRRGLEKLQRQAGNRAVNELLSVSQPGDRLEQAAGQTQRGATGPSRIPASQVTAGLQGSGSPLPQELRSQIEGELGGSLNGVRLHNDAAAGQAAERLNANAFTLGRQIAFAPGMYAPHSTAGRELLRHELAHTLQPTAGQVMRQPKKAPAPAPAADPLVEAESKIKDGLEKIDNNKAGDKKTAPAILRQGITALKKAAAAEKDAARQAKMLRICAGLETVIVTVQASLRSSGNLKSIQDSFSNKKEDVLGGREIAEGKPDAAATLYKNLPQEFTDIFPKIGTGDAGVNLLFITDAAQSRLKVMDEMGKAGAPAKKYPPEPGEVEAYFTKLGAAKAKVDEVSKAYEDYAQAFFKHGDRDLVSADMTTVKVYSGKMNFYGSILTDCDGFVRLGVRLFGAAGYKLEEVVTGVKDAPEGSGDDISYNDAHAVARLSKDGAELYVSNQHTYANEGPAFDVKWKHPDAPTVFGRGMNLATAEKDAIDQLVKKAKK